MLEELPAGCPPGPSASEAEQRLAWFSRPFDFLRDCAARHGERFTVRMSGGIHVIVSDPEGIREIFRGDPEDLHGGKAYEGLRPLFGESSIMLLDGEPHLKQRKILLPAFHGSRLSAHGRVIQEIVREVSDSWPTGKPFHLLNGMMDISQEVILRTILGMGDSDRYEVVKESLRDFMALISTGVTVKAAAKSSSATERIRGVSDAFDAVLVAEFRERRAHPRPTHDALQLLLEARHEDDTPLSDEELRDQLRTLAVGGHETTGATLAAALCLLVEHPAISERLVREIDSLGPNPEPDEVARLPYLTAVCNETLRVWPVFPMVSRWLPRPLHVAGMDLPAGICVTACTYLAHRRPAVFPEPDRFLPDRFLNRDYLPFEFLPFGGGVRRCVGMGFAFYEIRLVLARLLATFQFESAAQKPFRPVRHSAILAPSESARMRLVRRDKERGVHAQ